MALSYTPLKLVIHTGKLKQLLTLDHGSVLYTLTSSPNPGSVLYTLTSSPSPNPGPWLRTMHPYF